MFQCFKMVLATQACNSIWTIVIVLSIGGLCFWLSGLGSPHPGTAIGSNENSLIKPGSFQKGVCQPKIAMNCKYANVFFCWMQLFGGCKWIQMTLFCSPFPCATRGRQRHIEAETCVRTLQPAPWEVVAMVTSCRRLSQLAGRKLLKISFMPPLLQVVELWKSRLSTGEFFQWSVFMQVLLTYQKVSAKSCMADAAFLV